MGDKGECACCKEWKDLTVHHVTEANNAKIMVCFRCHRTIEEYLKILVKVRGDKN